MQQILDFVFQSFWHWLGSFILLTIPFRFVIALIREISDFFNTRKHGWKPVQPKSTPKEIVIDEVKKNNNL